MPTSSYLAVGELCQSPLQLLLHRLAVHYGLHPAVEGARHAGLHPPRHGAARRLLQLGVLPPLVPRGGEVAVGHFGQGGLQLLPNALLILHQGHPLVPCGGNVAVCHLFQRSL